MTRVAIVGCGVISRTYAHTISQLGFVELVACVDQDEARAAELAATFGTQPRSLDDVLSDPDIDAVVNLTPPVAHAAVSGASLDAGKATFSEKPLGVDFADGQALVAAQHETEPHWDAHPIRSSVRGCRRHARSLTAAISANQSPRTRSCSDPVPKVGTRTLRFSISTAPDRSSTWVRTTSRPLSSCSDRLEPLAASARISHARRQIRSEPRRGELIDVEVPTHVASLVEFVSGPIATLVTSFDVQATRYANIEVYGTEATLAVPNPNTFGGPVRVKRNGDESWTDIELLPTHLPQQRGIGLGDMLWAQRSGRAHRTSSTLALHVLEMMTSALASADQGRRIDLDTRCERAAPLPVGLGPEYLRRLMETLRYGIVGSGFVSQFHLRALESVRGVEVAGLTSRTAPAELAASVRARGLGEARVFDDVRTMTHDVDVVAIFNANPCRVEVMEGIAAAVRDGATLRGLICEKPLARNLAEGAPGGRSRDSDRRADGSTSRIRST